MKFVACAVAVSALSVSGTAFADVIEFELGGPANFSRPTALRDAYAGVGVLFSGPTPLNGGGVLHQDSNFGVSARSGTDFLAFNELATYRDGGRSVGPQTISFAAAQSFVEIYASGGENSSSLRMDAYDGADALIGTSGVVEAPGGVWTPISVTAPGIRRIVITETLGDTAYVLDDLTYTPLGCAADFNGDNQVDFFDYLDFVVAFDGEDESADFNGDEQVDFFDYLDFVEAFGEGC